MQGLMQDWPLTLDRIIQHAAKWHGDRQVVSRRSDGSLDRTSYADVETTARRFSSALLSLGIVPGDRVATMAMNSGRHLECWYGIMGIGAICHTLNPRLFNADLEYIVNRAADSVVIVDRSLAAKLAEVLPGCPSVRHVVVIDGAGSVTNESAQGYVSGTIMMRSSRLIRRRRGGASFQKTRPRAFASRLGRPVSPRGSSTPIDPISCTP